MPAPAGPHSGIQTHRNSVRLPTPELIRNLRNVLGTKLVTYVGSVKETRAVHQ